MWVGLLIFYVTNVANVTNVRLLRFEDYNCAKISKTISVY